MLEVETVSLIQDFHLKPLRIKAVLNANDLEKIHLLIAVPNSVDHNLTNRHFDKIRLIGIASSQERQVVRDVFYQFSVL